VTLTNLIAALILVESSGNDLAIGDNGRALGPLQIHRAVVEDANRISGRSYQWHRMTNRAESIQVCAIYLSHYASGKTTEATSRIWNGGPTGHRKPSTIAYWRKVQRQLEKLKVPPSSPQPSRQRARSLPGSQGYSPTTPTPSRNLFEKGESGDRRAVNPNPKRVSRDSSPRQVAVVTVTERKRK